MPKMLKVTHIVFDSLIRLLLGYIVISLLSFSHEIGHFAGGILVGIIADKVTTGTGPIIWMQSFGNTSFYLHAFPSISLTYFSAASVSEATKAQLIIIHLGGVVVNFVFFMLFGMLYAHLEGESFISTLKKVANGSPLQIARAFLEFHFGRRALLFISLISGFMVTNLLPFPNSDGYHIIRILISDLLK